MTGKYLIMPFSEKYRKPVIELWEKCGLFYPGNDPDTDIDIKMKFQPELFFIGMSGERVVSTLMAGFDGHRGWLNYLGVHPDFRKKGYAGSIVSYAMEKLRELGCPKLNLQVRNSNTGVIEFYKRLGFYHHDVTSMQIKLSDNS